MNNKKNKKQRGGFVDMTNPMVIGVIVILCLACIYLGLVFMGGFDANPLEWFNSETDISSEISKMLPTTPALFRSDSAEPLGVQVGNTLQDLEKPIPKPVTNPDLFKTGGKLLKKFRRK